MQMFESNVEDFTKARAGDEKLALRFFTKAAQDAEATAREGRPIFKEVEYIQIVNPGDRTTTNIRPIGPADKGRFAQQIAHWRATQQSEQLVGTPLEAWGIMSLAQIEEYRYFGVRTIDQMGDLRDDVCQKIMGATTLKQRAQKFLQLAKDEAPVKAVHAELKKRDEEIEMLKQAIADQGAQLKALKK